jgi:P22 coat protein - gene protein 5
MSANSVLTPSIISKETLVMLENNLVAAGKVNRQFENQFVKIGSTLTVRKPNRFKVVSGPGLQIQDVVEPSTSITISNQKHVDFQFSNQELTLVIEEFSERYLKPAAAELANQLDYDVISNYTSVFNEVGVPGTVPANFAALGAVGQRMDEGAVPQDGRVLMLNPAAYWSMAAGLSGLFVTSVAEPALKGFLAKIANFEIYLDQNIQVQTIGAYAGSGVVNSAGQTGSSITTTGWTGSINGLLNVGDVITIGGVFAVNPKNRQSTGQLQNFVVTSTVNSSGGAATIPIYPPITVSGAYQTVSNSPANNAPIVVKGTASSAGNPSQYAQNLGFVKDAFGLVTVPLELPEGVDFKARQEYKGISMAIIRAFDIQNYVFPCRIDILYGTTTYYPELAVRLTN